MIRDFVRADTDQVLDMVRELRSESPFHAALPFDPDHVAMVLNAYTVRGWVADAEGTLRGACFATMVPSLLGPGRICTDLSVFVRKPFRNGTLAARFLREMARWGDALGAVAHQHVISTGNPNVERLYQRLGYERSGSAFVKSASRP